jgi:hypothetical protein
MSDPEIEVGVYFRSDGEVSFSRDSSADLHDEYERRIAEFDRGAQREG